MASTPDRILPERPDEALPDDQVEAIVFHGLILAGALLLSDLFFHRFSGQGGGSARSLLAVLATVFLTWLVASQTPWAKMMTAVAAGVVAAVAYSWARVLGWICVWGGIYVLDLLEMIRIAVCVALSSVVGGGLALRTRRGP